MIYSFMCDYSEGAHPAVLKAVADECGKQHGNYGIDECCDKAAALIKNSIHRSDADVHFLPGGTAVNLTVIAHVLRPFEAVIAAKTGHIAVHETGAIEASGHKVVTVDGTDGKLTPKEVEDAVLFHTDEHMVRPAMVYISNSTELGTIYTKAELTALRKCCDEHGLLLMLDGARLFSALASEENDLSLADIAALTDCFYIGGTKNGALFGEALVILNDNLKTAFRFSIKQRGHLTAKGFLLGTQFGALFTDMLCMDIARHENKCATEIANTLKDLGVPFFAPAQTNQLFPILPDVIAEKLGEDFELSIWKKYDASHSVVRLVTSWSTPQWAVDALNEKLTKLCK